MATQEKIFAKLCENKDAIRVLEGKINSVEADGVYRFYHQSFKVYSLQAIIESCHSFLKKMAGELDCSLNDWFVEIIKDGCSKQFSLEVNSNWTANTRPICEAFFHCKHMIELCWKYANATSINFNLIESGWATILYLFNSRSQ